MFAALLQLPVCIFRASQPQQIFPGGDVRLSPRGGFRLRRHAQQRLCAREAADHPAAVGKPELHAVAAVDLFHALKIGQQPLFKEKFPNRHLIGCIEGNYWGDIIIRTEDANFTYKVKEKELDIYIGTWKQGHWEKL